MVPAKCRVGDHGRQGDEWTGGQAIVGLRERKRSSNRAATVDAALALFADRGYDAVTVADICAAVPIAPRTFFRYFSSKEDLLGEPSREMAAELAAFLAAAPAGHDDAAVLRAAFHHLGEHLMVHRDRLTRFLQVMAETTSTRASPMIRLSEQERELAERLVNRRGGSADFASRLLVARAVAGFRVWLGEFTGGTEYGTVATLDEALAVL